MDTRCIGRYHKGETLKLTMARIQRMFRSDTCKGESTPATPVITHRLVAPSFRFYVAESSSDDSDGSSTKGRRRFRQRRKLQRTNLARSGDSLRRLRFPSAGILDGMAEIALQNQSYGGSSDVSSLSCHEVYSDEEILEVHSDPESVTATVNTSAKVDMMMECESSTPIRGNSVTRNDE
jgi:hypothetical protein